MPVKKLIEITARTITPASIGRIPPSSDYLFRVTELRGVAAWWLRALVGGIAVEKSLDEIEVASTAQSEIFGSSSSSSRIHIRVKEMIPRRLNHRDIDSLSNLPRIRLFTMGRRDNVANLISSMFVHWKVTIEINTSALTPGIHDKLGVWAIILALLLSGLGKGGRRGLGSFLIADIKDYEGLLREVADDILALKLTEDIRLVKEKIKNIIRMAKSDADQLVSALNSKHRFSGRNPNGIPAFPVIANNYFAILGKSFNSSNATNVLRLIQGLFLRTQADSLAAHLQGVSNDPRNASTQIGSYFLGLPRSQPRKNIFRCLHYNLQRRFGEKIRNIAQKQKLRNALLMGYKSSASDRRASPVIAKFLNDKVAIISVFLSRDWPDDLVWYSLHLHPRPVRGRVAYNIFYYCVDIGNPTSRPKLSYNILLSSSKSYKPTVQRVLSVQQAYSEVLSILQNQNWLRLL